MGENVLVAMDNSPPAWDALEHAITQHQDAVLTILHVVSTTDYSRHIGNMGNTIAKDEWIEPRRKTAKKILSRARNVAISKGIEADTVIEYGNPSTDIVVYTQKKSFDHIIIGSHNRTGISRMVLGSISEAVARRSSVPVTIVS